MSPPSHASPDRAFDASGRPWSPRCHDGYGSGADAFAEAQALFVAGCRIDERWRARERFAIVELGFGLGVKFLATLATWRADPRRPARLDYLSTDEHPLDTAALARAFDTLGVGSGDARSLLEQWPMPLPGLHRIAFADARVTLTLAVGDVARMSARLPVAADAFYLDGFDLARNPAMWTPGLMKSLARLARPGATLVARCGGAAVREALSLAGFQPHPESDPADTHGRILAEYAPRWRSFAPPAPDPVWPEREAVIVGAGLAGCAIAAALGRRGWRVRILDRGDGAALEGSAQPAVADHLHVAPDDNPLARLTRAALLLQRASNPQALPSGKLQIADSDSELERQFECARSLGFPKGYLQALDADSAAEAAGVRVARGGLWMPLCGWIDPAQRCLEQLDDDPARITLQPGANVATLRQRDGLWEAIDSAGARLAYAPVMILACAGDAPRLAGQSAFALRRVRGQTTHLPPGALAGLRAVIGGDAYACPLPDGSALIGSTFDDGDTLDPDPLADLSNLRRLARMLTPDSAPPRILLAGSRPGACGFRFAAHDRLPLIGALPDEGAIRARAAEFVRNDRLALPTLHGLYGAFAFGARGLLWSSLSAELLAAAIDGGAAPVETDLLSAVAPSRFIRQQLRRRRLR